MNDRPPHEYIPPGPLDTAPGGRFHGPMVRREAFTAVLAGVPLGAYDQRIIDWLCGLDDTTCRTVASLLWRAREAGRAEGAQPPEGTVTEWGVRQTFPSGEERTYTYGGHEEAARTDAGGAAGCVVVSRQVGPWAEVPETEPEEDGSHG